MVHTWLKVDSKSRAGVDRPEVVTAPTAVDSQNGNGRSNCKNMNWLVNKHYSELKQNTQNCTDTRPSYLYRDNVTQSKAQHLSAKKVLILYQNKTKRWALRWSMDQCLRYFIYSQDISNNYIPWTIYYGRKKYCRYFFLTAEIEKALTFFL